MVIIASPSVDYCKPLHLEVNESDSSVTEEKVVDDNDVKLERTSSTVKTPQDRLSKPFLTLIEQTSQPEQDKSPNPSDVSTEQTPSTVKLSQQDKLSNPSDALTEQTPQSQQNEHSNPSDALTELEPNHFHDESDKQSLTNQPEINRERIGFDRIISSLADSSRQSEELAANLRDLNPEAATTGADQSNTHRETETTRNNITEDNRAAAELTRELQNLEQRAIRSSLQDRETRKPSAKSDRRNPGQFIAKIKQLARDIFTNSSNIETGEIWSTPQIGNCDDNQTPRTTQRNLDNFVGDLSGDMDTHSFQSSQPENTSRNKRQSQQQRNSSQSSRKETRRVKPSTSASLSQPLDQLHPSNSREKEIEKNHLNTPISHSTEVAKARERVRLNKEEVNQIAHTARSAIKRYGSKKNEKTTFENSYYRIEKCSVFENHRYRSYLTIDALDGRGRLLTMKGENFHLVDLKAIENHLTKQDVSNFEKIQSVFDYLQQIRQFQENAATILKIYGKRNNSPHPLYKTFEGENYRIERDSESLRITAKDGRGEIFSYPSDLHVRNPEAEAVSNLERKDVEWLFNVALEIKQKLREAERRLEKEREPKQGRGLGL